MVEQAPPANVEEPKEPPKEQAKPKDPAAELHSRYRTQLAQAHKETKAAQQDASSARTELDEKSRFIKALQDRGELSEDETTRLEGLARAEAALDKRMQSAEEFEKRVSAQWFSVKYGVPEEDLLAYDNPKDMKIAALEAALDLPKATDPEEEEPEPVVPVRQPSGFDLGAGALTGKQPKDMSKKEFDAFVARGQAAARARARAQR